MYETLGGALDKKMILGISIPTALAIVFFILFLVFVILYVKKKKECEETATTSFKSSPKTIAPRRKF